MELTPEWVFSAADHTAMGVALGEAAKAGAIGEVPVGAVVVAPSGEVIAKAHNRRESERDPTAHAEVLALRAAARYLGDWRLEGCTLYVTLEPCAMCTGACGLARLACVVWGAPDPGAGFVGSLGNLLDDPRTGFRVKWRGGLRASEASTLLESFFAKLRGRL
ncbi:MAG: nucleoside deaminase [Thermoanaerobaculales bacterium]